MMRPLLRASLPLLRLKVWLIAGIGMSAIAPVLAVQNPQPGAKPSAMQSKPATQPRPAKTPPASKKAAEPTPPAPVEHWLTWGGPRRNFIVSASGLESSWPEGGPRRIWSRPLGDGYSAIAEENGILYTAYRRGSDDVVTALDAESGKTIWETAYAAPFQNAGGGEIANGPYAMPQVVGDRLVTASGVGKISSLDKQTGRIVWSHDVYTEYGGTRLPFGYSCHALPYKDTLIVLVGGRGGLMSRLTGASGSGVIAFKQSDGAVAWQNLSFDNAHSSPLLISVDGQAQVVALLAQEVIGFSPDDGKLLWRHPHPTEHGLAISTPVWGPDNILVVSSAYGGGSRGLELRQAQGQTQVKELWHNPRVQLHFGTMIRIGDHVYLSSAYTGPAFMTAVDVKTGTVAWQHRGFAKAHLLHADGKFVLLDEDGTLALLMATPQRFQVLSQTSLLKKIAWTPPTLVGTRLYVRDRASIMALNLGPAASAKR
jgi:outer membrane protein assembly factor BamB